MGTDTDFIDGKRHELTVTAVSMWTLGIGDTRITKHTLESETGVDGWLLSDRMDEHERESVPLAVPEEWTATFEQFWGCLAAEREVLGGEPTPDETAARDRNGGHRSRIDRLEERISDDTEGE